MGGDGPRRKPRRPCLPLRARHLAGKDLDCEGVSRRNGAAPETPLTARCEVAGRARRGLGGRGTRGLLLPPTSSLTGSLLSRVQ